MTRHLRIKFVNVDDLQSNATLKQFRLRITSTYFRPELCVAQIGRFRPWDEIERTHGMNIRQRRVHFRNLNGSDAQRPHIAAIVILAIRLKTSGKHATTICIAIQSPGCHML